MKNKGILSDKEFLGNVGKLFGASAIAQAIPFFILPVLTRIYGPEEFGVWVYFLSISGILSIVLTGNYEFAVMLPKERKEATSTIVLTLALGMISSIILCISTLLFHSQLNLMLGFEVNSWLIYAIPLMAFLFSTYRACNLWNNRNNLYGITARSNVGRSVSLSASQLYYANSIGSTYAGLIVGSLLGYFIGIILQMQDILKAVTDKTFTIRIGLLKEQLVKFRKFPQFFLFSELTNYFSSNIPVLFLTNLFNSTAAGLYSIPHKFINVPMTMLGTSVSQVYYRKAAQLKEDKVELGKITLDIYQKMIFLGIIPLSIVAAYGDIIFGIILGEKWTVAGQYARMLAPWMLLVFATSPISIIFAVLEKQKESLKLNIILLIIRLAAFLVGGLIFDSAFWAVALFGGSGFVYWLYFSFYVLKISGSNLKSAKLYVIKSFTYIMIPIILSRMVFIWLIQL